MFQYWKKHKKQALMYVICICIIGPLIINVLFKFHFPIDFFVAEWTAGDALSFYSAIVASILAIYGISISIRASNHSFEEGLRYQMLPFIIVDFQNTKPIKTDILEFNITEESPDLENDSFEEYSLKEFVFIIEDEKIDFKSTLSGHQRTVVEHGGLLNIPAGKGMIATISEDFIYQSMLLENVGNGAAVHTRIGLNLQDTPHDKRKYVFPVPIKVGGTLKICIYGDKLSEKSKRVNSVYEFEILYQDIYGNKYRQCHELYIKYDYSKHHSRLVFTTPQEQEILPQ